MNASNIFANACICLAEQEPTDIPKNDKDYEWQHRMDIHMHQKPKMPGKTLPPDIYTRSPSEIANLLKQHSKDYQHAISRIQSYINRQGKNLQGADRSRLFAARDAVRAAYGVPSQGLSDNKATAFVNDLPYYSTPDQHDFDAEMLNTGFDEQVTAAILRKRNGRR